MHHSHNSPNAAAPYLAIIERENRTCWKQASIVQTPAVLQKLFFQDYRSHNFPWWAWNSFVKSFESLIFRSHVPDNHYLGALFTSQKFRQIFSLVGQSPDKCHAASLATMYQMWNRKSLIFVARKQLLAKVYSVSEWILDEKEIVIKKGESFVGYHFLSWGFWFLDMPSSNRWAISSGDRFS